MSDEKKYMVVRKATQSDVPHWARMRDALWPDSISTNTIEIEQYFSNQANHIKECFLVIADETPVGFIELNIRSYAEGSDQAEIPYVEGWFVDATYRGRGLGKSLMDEAETWAKAKGFTEIASDAELNNSGSIGAHNKLGFEETDRIVCFLKQLD